MQNPEELQEFDLEDILNEFGNASGEEPEAEDAPQIPEAPADQQPEEVSKEAPVQQEEVSQAAPDEKPQTVRLEKLSDVAAQPSQEEKKPEPAPKVIELDPRARLRELKKKLVAGPEKRYYELSELGVGKLQLSVFLNILIVLLCAAATTLFVMDIVPENRLRLLIFSQVLAMLVSALLGCQQMLDGLGDLLRLRFTANTMLAVTFLVCCADSVLCLRDLRVPCCAAFSLEMALAQLGSYHTRATQMAQMDTLRKAVRLHSLVKVPDFHDGKPGILRGYGEVDHFMENYEKTTGPEKLRNVFAFVSLLLCIGISVFSGLLHGAAMSVQILSTSLLVALPASYFIALSRPAAVLQKRLHMVGTVLCGWQGVKSMKGKHFFALKDEDVFPNGSTKLNGVKFYGDRSPDEVVAYTSSLISAAGGGLVGVFQQLLKSRGCREYPVKNFRSYDAGGIGGEIAGESVLLGSAQFLRDMGVEIPEGTMVNQAVYAAIDLELSAVVAISYAKMRSAAGGLVSLTGSRKLTPILVGSDFMLNESLISSKFGVKTNRMVFPSQEQRQALSQIQAPENAVAMALTTREELISFAYAISGARSLRTACKLGSILHIFGGVLGMVIMLVLGFLGSTELLTPTNVLLYQLVWLLPGVLITEWTRAV